MHIFLVGLCMVGRQTLEIFWDVGDEQTIGIAIRFLSRGCHLGEKQSSVITYKINSHMLILSPLFSRTFLLCHQQGEREIPPLST
jgi:hypothetical protein